MALNLKQLIEEAKRDEQDAANAKVALEKVQKSLQEVKKVAAEIAKQSKDFDNAEE